MNALAFRHDRAGLHDGAGDNKPNPLYAKWRANLIGRHDAVFRDLCCARGCEKSRRI